MRWPEALKRLQEVDHDLENIAHRLEEIAATLEEREQVVLAAEDAHRCSAEVEVARRRQEELEFELNRVEAKLRQTEQKLYSGRVTNPRELADLQAEAQSLQRRRSQLEDELLEAMLAYEDAVQAAEKAESYLAEVKAEWEGRHTRLQEEQAQLYQYRQQLHKERESLVVQIPTSVMDSYRYLWERTGGWPVAQLRGDVCGVCGMSVDKPTQLKVHRGEEAYCDGCRRLLVA